MFFYCSVRLYQHHYLLSFSDCKSKLFNRFNMHIRCLSKCLNAVYINFDSVLLQAFVLLLPCILCNNQFICNSGTSQLQGLEGALNLLFYLEFYLIFIFVLLVLDLVVVYNSHTHF